MRLQLPSIKSSTTIGGPRQIPLHLMTRISGQIMYHQRKRYFYFYFSCKKYVQLIPLLFLFQVPRLSAADSSEGYPSVVWSDDESRLSKLRHVYPVLPAAAASMMYIPKSTAFPSQNSEPKPTFINAGWGDSSEGSEL
jgi:hypothetical protein